MCKHEHYINREQNLDKLENSLKRVVAIGDNLSSNLDKILICLEKIMIINNNNKNICSTKTKKE